MAIFWYMVPVYRKTRLIILNFERLKSVRLSWEAYVISVDARFYFSCKTDARNLFHQRKTSLRLTGDAFSQTVIESGNNFSVIINSFPADRETVKISGKTQNTNDIQTNTNRSRDLSCVTYSMKYHRRITQEAEVEGKIPERKAKAAATTTTTAYSKAKCTETNIWHCPWAFRNTFQDNTYKLFSVVRHCRNTQLKQTTKIVSAKELCERNIETQIQFPKHEGKHTKQQPNKHKIK